MKGVRMFPTYSLMFLFFALAQTALFVWLWRIYRETREPVAAMLLFPQFFLIWDNLRVASGIVIGFGDVLYWLTWPVFWIHWLAGCWLIIACGAILRLADFEFAQSKWVMGGFCLIATALIAHDLPYFWTKEIYPVCEFDLIRYGGSVSEASRCFADQALVDSEFPLAPVVTCFVVIGTGALLWLRRGFPWFAVGGTLMLMSAAIPVLFNNRLDNLGEVMIKGGAFWAIWHFTRAKVARARVDQTPATAAPAQESMAS
jgi:hypothetical protein